MGASAPNAEEQPYAAGAAAPSIAQEQMSFTDGNAGTCVDFPTSSISDFDPSGMSGLELGDFLQRPVLIKSFSWAENTSCITNFDPWNLFFTHPVIKRKIDNYAFLRCNLHLRFTMSASQFYYGKAIISYNPTPDSHQPATTGGLADIDIVTKSQRPHIWLDVTDSEGGTMELPFFYHYPWVGNKPDELTSLGKIDYDSPTVLRNCNGVAGQTVTINCYAWATDVQLTGPTLELQSLRSRKVKRREPKTSNATSLGEYGDSPISNVASAVAMAGAALSNVPVIGAFARATELGAGTVAKVASWFGYTNVPVISNVAPFKDLPFGGFASSEIGAPTPKLTLDPKNELTIDSRTVGLDGTDELSFQSFLERETYLTNFNWNTSDAPQDALFGIGISPSVMVRREGLDVWSTPMAHLASCYQYWSGDVILRFRIVCSKFHKGRIKIQFDPYQSTDLTPPYDNTAISTHIYDIGETRDIEMRVPYTQAQSLLPNMDYGSGEIAFGGNPTGLTGLQNTHNGYVLVSVANELTSPVADAPVSILVSIRAAENFRFLGPKAPRQDVYWKSQSETVKKDEFFEAESEEPAFNLVYGGETALSIRQLLHRHCFVRSFFKNFSLSDPEMYFGTFYMYPLSMNAESSTRNIHEDGLNRFNYVRNSFVSWFSPCFAGRRGSMYWAVNAASNGSDPLRTSFIRAPQTSTSLLPTQYDAYAPQGTDNNVVAYNSLVGPIGKSGNGAAVYHSDTQAGATALIPYISARRYSGTHPQHFDTSVTVRDYVPEGLVNLVCSEGFNNDATGDIYCASGPDFNLFFNCGVPTLTIGSPSAPTPP